MNIYEVSLTMKVNPMWHFFRNVKPQQNNNNLKVSFKLYQNGIKRLFHLYSLFHLISKFFFFSEIITIINFLQLFRHLFKLNNRLISMLIEFKRNLVTISPRLIIPEIKYHIGFTLIVRDTS